MTLSKQLYLIISFIFFMIFAGNFIISTNNFKQYLELESQSKAQDTATSLGVRLKPLVNNNKNGTNNSEILSTIKVIGDSGFYKAISIEMVQFDFYASTLLEKHILDSKFYTIKDLQVDPKDGEIVNSNADDDLASELSALEGSEDLTEAKEEIKYTFIPSASFPKQKEIIISFTAVSETKTIQLKSKIMIDKVLAEVSKEEKFDNVPQWFINTIPMKTVQTKSEISNWKTQAIVYVSANAGEAYEKLYEQAKGAIYYAIVSFIIAFSILVIFLRFILKPLKDIEQLSEDISQGDFRTIDNLPWTTELKNVSISMNDMSNKIKNMINKLNANLEKSTTQLSKDDLTSLQLEQTFQTDMKQMFIKKHEGYVFSIKINDLGDFSKHNSHTVVDKFLKAFAKALENSDKDIKAYRFFGSTFAMISRKTELKDIEKITQNLKTVFGELGKEYNIVNVANIGATPFNPISTTDAILAQANESYELSKQVGANEASIRDKNDLARDMQVWKELIFDIIDNSKFKVGYINQVLSMDGQKNTIMEEAFTSATDKDGKNIPIGTFISIAEKYNKVIDFDKAVINRVIRHISQDGITHNIHINLAFDSLLDNNFKHWLKDTLSKSQSIASQLVFSVTAYGCVRDIESFKKFALETRENGAKIILKRFETKFIPSDTLKDFNLDYIRLAREYTSGIANDSTKQNIVESICEISKLFKIEVLAESVKDDESFEKLKELGLFGASK